MERTVRNQFNQIIASALKIVRSAFLDYFAPVFQFIRWVRAAVRMPILVERNAGSALKMRRRQQKERLAIEEIAHLTTLTFTEIKGLKREIEHVLDYRSENLPVLLNHIQERLDSLEQSQSENLVSRYLFVAGAMRRRGATEHATEVLRLLCSVAERRDLPSTSYACFNFGELLFEKSDLEQAQIFFDKVIKKNKPENVVAAAYARSAAIFNLKADPEKAIFAAERAVEIYRRLDKPESLAHTYLQLARALSAAGKSQRAVEALDQAMKLPIRLESLLLPPRGWMEQSETLKKDMSRNSFHVDPAVS